MPHVTWRFLRAICLARSGNNAAAEELASEAVRLAEDTDDLNLQADARLALADVLVASGRPTEAKEAAREAVALFERKGNVVSADLARRWLDEPPYARGAARW